MRSQLACRSLSVILILFNFHLSLMLLVGSRALLWAPPPDSPSPSLSMLCFMNHTGTLVNECLLLSYPRKDVIVTQLSFTSSHYSNITQTRRPWKAFKINICVAFKSQYILYLLWVVWHLGCNIILLWISMLQFVGLIWYLPYGGKLFNLSLNIVAVKDMIRGMIIG